MGSFIMGILILFAIAIFVEYWIWLVLLVLGIASILLLYAFFKKKDEQTEGNIENKKSRLLTVSEINKRVVKPSKKQRKMLDSKAKRGSLKEIETKVNAQMNAEIWIKQLNDCIKLVQTTVDPSVFFQRLDMLIERANSLANANTLGYIKLNIDISKMLPKEYEVEKLISDFILRSYENTLRGAETLKTVKGKKNRIEGYFASMDAHIGRMTISNLELLQNLKVGSTKSFEKDVKGEPKRRIAKSEPKQNKSNHKPKKSTTKPEIENVEHKKIIVSVDEKTLEKIRFDALATQESLIVDVPLDIPVSPSTTQNVPPLKNHIGLLNVWSEFKQVLTQTEIDAIDIILRTGSINIFANDNNIMVEVLVDSINEKSVDIIGDNVIDLSEGVTIYSEYVDNLKSLVL